MIQKINLYFFVLLLICSCGYSKECSGQYSYSLNYFGGQMVSHSKYTKELESSIYGVQIEALWKLRKETDDLSNKNKQFKLYPQIGISSTWMDMGVTSTGYQFGAGLILGAVLTDKNSLSMAWHFSHGLTYLSEKYDTLQKPINYAIGSTLNYFAQLKGALEYNLSPNLSLNAGLYLTHASNGNWRKPNVGLNAIHYGIGLIYFPNEIYNSDRASMYLHKKKFFAFPYSVGIKLAIREHTIEYPVSFSVFITDFQYRIQKSANHIWDIGFDLFSDANYKFDKMGNSTGIDESQELELGIKGGHQFVYGRVGLRTDLGIYVLRPILSDKPFFYNAIGIDYRLSQDWVLRSRLKAHLNVADYMEFGLSRLF